MQVTSFTYSSYTVADSPISIGRILDFIYSSSLLPTNTIIPPSPFTARLEAFRRCRGHEQIPGDL